MTLTQRSKYYYKHVPSRQKIYLILNLATWLRQGKFTASNISKFYYLKSFFCKSYHNWKSSKIINNKRDLNLLKLSLSNFAKFKISLALFSCQVGTSNAFKNVIRFAWFVVNCIVQDYLATVFVFTCYHCSVIFPLSNWNLAFIHIDELLGWLKTRKNKW